MLNWDNFTPDFLESSPRLDEIGLNLKMGDHQGKNVTTENDRPMNAKNTGYDHERL